MSTEPINSIYLNKNWNNQYIKDRIINSISKKTILFIIVIIITIISFILLFKINLNNKINELDRNLFQMIQHQNHVIEINSKRLYKLENKTAFNLENKHTGF